MSQTLSEMWYMAIVYVFWYLYVLGAGKLGITDATQLRVILSSDGTEVDDDEIFTAVASQPLMLLQPNEFWFPEIVSSLGSVECVTGELSTTVEVPVADEISGASSSSTVQVPVPSADETSGASSSTSRDSSVTSIRLIV